MAQYVVTALSSAFNACYFLGYRSATMRRRIGAMVLALVSLAILVESFYFGFSAVFQEQQESILWLGTRLLICLSSLAISVLILRRLAANRG
jgi:hypothetical protein